MQPFRLSNLVVLAALLCTGDAIKCYEGFQGTQKTIDCPGSCSTTTVRKTSRTILSCGQTQLPETCFEGEALGITAEVCYCNSDYCNTSPTTNSLTTAIPIAYPTNTGAAIKCYEGSPGTQKTIDCQGSCTRGTERDTGITLLGCVWLRVEVPETCVDVKVLGKQVEACYCTSDYCNAQPFSSSSTFLSSRPSSSSTPLPSRPSSASISLPSLLLLIPLLFSFVMPHVF